MTAGLSKPGGLPFADDAPSPPGNTAVFQKRRRRQGTPKISDCCVFESNENRLAERVGFEPVPTF